MVAPPRANTTCPRRRRWTLGWCRRKPSSITPSIPPDPDTSSPVRPGCTTVAAESQPAEAKAPARGYLAASARLGRMTPDRVIGQQFPCIATTGTARAVDGTLVAHRNGAGERLDSVTVSARSVVLDRQLGTATAAEGPPSAGWAKAQHTEVPLPGPRTTLPCFSSAARQLSTTFLLALTARYTAFPESAGPCRRNSRIRSSTDGRARCMRSGPAATSRICVGGTASSISKCRWTTSGSTLNLKAAGVSRDTPAYDAFHVYRIVRDREDPSTARTQRKRPSTVLLR